MVWRAKFSSMKCFSGGLLSFGFPLFWLSDFGPLSPPHPHSSGPSYEGRKVRYPHPGGICPFHTVSMGTVEPRGKCLTHPPQTCSTSAGISGTVGGHRIFWKEWGPQPHPLPVGWAVLGNRTISVSLGISESQPGELKPDPVPVLIFLLWGSEPCPPSACFPDPTPPGMARSQVWRLSGHVFRAAWPQSQQAGLTQTKKMCFLTKTRQTSWLLSEGLEPGGLFTHFGLVSFSLKHTITHTDTWTQRHTLLRRDTPPPQIHTQSHTRTNAEITHKDTVSRLHKHNSNFHQHRNSHTRSHIYIHTNTQTSPHTEKSHTCAYMSTHMAPAWRRPPLPFSFV